MRIVYLFTPAAGKKIRLVFILLVFLVIMFPLVRIVKGNQPAVAGLSLAGKTILIDPGHGGYDPGVSSDGVDEKVVTLAISLALRDYLQSAGARVVMTRESDRDLLVLPTAGPKKRQDMKNRLHIIGEANPDLFVSIHANSISSSRWRGAQVFYKEGGEQSKSLAELIQQEFVRILANTDRQVKPGNYLLLNESEIPAVIVETGFLSNPHERRLLITEEYQSKVAWSIYLGIVRYFAQNTNNPA